MAQKGQPQDAHTRQRRMVRPHTWRSSRPSHVRQSSSYRSSFQYWRDSTIRSFYSPYRAQTIRRWRQISSWTMASRAILKTGRNRGLWLRVPDGPGAVLPGGQGGGSQHSQHELHLPYLWGRDELGLVVVCGGCAEVVQRTEDQCGSPDSYAGS